MFCALGVMTALLFMAFYIHDKAAAEGICRKAAGMGVRQAQENVSLETGELELRRLEEKSILWRLLQSFDYTEEEGAGRAKEQLDQILLLGRNPSVRAEVLADKATVEYQMEWEAPFGIWKSFLPKGSWTVRGSVTVKRMEAEEFIRLCKGMLQ